MSIRNPGWRVCCLWWLLGSCTWGTLAGAASLESAVQKRVRAATFEVVVPKPSEAAVKYERPPPVELLSFAERNDKFWPIGTAFAISKNTFVTAAHVFSSALGGQGGPPVLRDSQGRSYAIRRVDKYSGHQDFVVFTADIEAPAPLVPAATPELDAPVFAVGNALGEGVVIRDGVFTSLTAEEQDGRWKWLRYSAATSPGNSGGPLLNAAGEVIGVVIGKSESENLNYALPIQHVLEADAVARVQQRFPLRLPMLRDSMVARLDINFGLPLPLPEFTQRLTAEAARALRAERARALTEKASELPPRGKSEAVLNSAEWAVCPLLLMQDKNREWEAGGGPADTRKISNGGEVCSREVGASMTLFSLDRGSVAAAGFYSNRQQVMDLLLEGLRIPRNFGQESVALTSFGPPTSDVPHRDTYGRAWRLVSFAIPFADFQILAMMLPTPEGYAGMLSLVPRGGLDLVSDELRLASDFFYVGYHGTLPQWQAFMAHPDRPPVLAAVKITRDAQGLHYRSPRVDFDVPPAMLALDDSSTIQLSMAYSAAGQGLVWDVGAIFVSDDKKDERFLSLIRQRKPAADASKKRLDRWNDMIESRGDFWPGRGHDDDYRKLWRRSVISADYRPGAAVDRNAALFYEVTTSISGAKLPRDIDVMHELLMENVRVKER